MTTVRQIQDDIINPEVRLSDILRKAKVLSYRLNVPEFKQWVDHELDGYYGEGVEMPNYRIVQTGSFGDFSGPAGSLMRNYPIPTINFPDWLQEHLDTIKLHNSVASLQDMARSEELALKLPWPADLIAIVGQPGQIVSGYALSSEWQVLSQNQLAAVLDTVRNPLLTFMLELEEQFPDLVESEEAAKDIPKEQAANIFHNYVYGGQNVIASGQDITQHTVFPPPDLSSGDLEALLDYVRELNVPEEDVSELREALEADEAPSELEELGPQTTGWLGKLAMKGFEGASSGATGQGVQYVGKAIAQYYGIDLGP